MENERGDVSRSELADRPYSKYSHRAIFWMSLLALCIPLCMLIPLVDSEMQSDVQKESERELHCGHCQSDDVGAINCPVTGRRWAWRQAYQKNTLGSKVWPEYPEHQSCGLLLLMLCGGCNQLPSHGVTFTTTSPFDNSIKHVIRIVLRALLLYSLKAWHF